MTLRDLMRPGGRFQPTETQLAISMRADRLFADRCGRFFGGQITREEAKALTAGLEVRPGTIPEEDTSAGQG